MNANVYGSRLNANVYGSHSNANKPKIERMYSKEHSNANLMHVSTTIAFVNKPAAQLYYLISSLI